MRITSKGQVTIPQDVRERMGLFPNTEVDFLVEGDTVRIVRSQVPKRASRGSRAVTLLRGGSKRPSMTTDQIMALTRDDR